MDAEYLPFANHSLNGVISSLTMQWCNLERVCKELARTLKPGAQVVATTLLDGTLEELKSAWAEVDDYVHVNRFLTASQVETALKQAGLRIKTMDARIELDLHPDIFALLRSLKAIGAHNMNPGQRTGLTTRRQFEQLRNAYESYRNAEGLLPATYHVVYLVAEKP